MTPLTLIGADAEFSLNKGDDGARFSAFKLENAVKNDYDFNKAVKMSDFFGKEPVVLNFFSVTCESCKEEIKQLHKIYKTYESNGINFFLVLVRAGEENAQEILKSIQNRNYEIPVLFHKYPEVVFKQYVKTPDGKTLSVPLMYMISSNGKVFLAKKGFDSKNPEKAVAELEEHLKALK